MADALFPSTAAVTVADPGATPGDEAEDETLTFVPSVVSPRKSTRQGLASGTLCRRCQLKRRGRYQRRASADIVTVAVVGGGGGPTIPSPPPPQDRGAIRRRSLRWICKISSSASAPGVVVRRTLTQVIAQPNALVLHDLRAVDLTKCCDCATSIDL